MFIYLYACTILGGQNFEFQYLGGQKNEYFGGMMKLWIYFFFWGGGAPHKTGLYVIYMHLRAFLKVIVHDLNIFWGLLNSKYIFVMPDIPDILVDKQRMLSPSLHIKKKLEHPSPGLSACVHIVSLTSCVLLIKKRRKKRKKRKKKQHEAAASHRRKHSKKKLILLFSYSL